MNIQAPMTATGWASEASKRTDLTSAESELLAASIEQADAASNGQEK